MFVAADDLVSVNEVPVELLAGNTQMDFRVDNQWGLPGMNNLVHCNALYSASICAFEGGVAFDGIDYGIITANFSADPVYYYNSVAAAADYTITIPDPVTTGSLMVFHQLDTGGVNGNITISPTNGALIVLTGEDKIVEYIFMGSRWEVMFAN